MTRKGEINNNNLDCVLICLVYRFFIRDHPLSPLFRLAVLYISVVMSASDHSDDSYELWQLYVNSELQPWAIACWITFTGDSQLPGVVYGI